MESPKIKIAMIFQNRASSVAKVNIPTKYAVMIEGQRNILIILFSNAEPESFTLNG
jgi:hypothetical protein